MTIGHVVVTQRFFDDRSIAFLRAHHCGVTIAPLPTGKADGDFSCEELCALLADADGWIVGHARVTADLLRALPKLKVISRRGVGYERVDLDAARQLGRVVTIAAGGNDTAVADHTLAMMLALGRRLRSSQRAMEAGRWAIEISTDLSEKTIGIIGLGRIGRSVVKRLAGFEATVLVTTTTPEAGYAAKTGVSFVDFSELLERSDYVTLHAPLNPATRFMIDAAALRRMKPSAFLVNTARGGLVDDAALLDTLQQETIAGAGLDVFVSESDASYLPVTAALLALPNVIATPHAGASSREGLDRTNMIAARSVVAVLEGCDPPLECIVADGRNKDLVKAIEKMALSG